MLDALAQHVARLEIETLNARFAYLIDHDLSHQVADLFTEDGVYQFKDGNRSAGREAIRHAYAARAAHGVRTARHIFTNLHLGLVSDRRAEGTCILLLFANDGLAPQPAQPLLVADYDDVYERDDAGVWRYRSRTISVAFSADGESGALPLGSQPAPSEISRAEN